MQNCIQRFRSRRRLQGDRTLFFNEYLFLGGIDTSPGAFTGLGRQDLRDLTPAERREATATDVIYGTTAAGARFYNGDDELWTIDFQGVAAGFFSVTLMQLSTFDHVKMHLGIDTIDNFLRYILQHDVCPEYEDDVKDSMTVAEAAREEWPMVHRLLASLPGEFNLAAKELFCPKDELFMSSQLPQDFNPILVFYAAMAVMDDRATFREIFNNRPKITRIFSCTLELVEITFPSDDHVKHVKSLLVGDKRVAIKPIGKAVFKQGTIEDEWDNPTQPWPVAEDTITLFFDDSILEGMKIGMRMTLKICELDIGLRFVKEVENVVPTFYTFLPQELMRHYKEPKVTDRPAPSVYDPDVEEKMHDIIAKED